MRGIYRKLYEILTVRERRRVLGVLALIFSAAIMETLGVASILPFIAVLSNPGIVSENSFISTIYVALGFSSVESFMFALGVTFFLVFLTGMVLRSIAFWAQARFSNNRMHSVSCRLLYGYLSRDYEWFLNRNTSTLAASVLSEASRAVSQALFPALQLVAHGTIVILLVCLLVVIEPLLAILTIGVLGSIYVSVFLTFRRWLSQIGVDVMESNRQRYRATQEAFGGLRDLKIKSLEKTFLGRFESASRRWADSQTAMQLIGQVPGYVIQTVVFGGMLAIILYLMQKHGGFSGALPVLAAYAMAGYRMLPSIQNGYGQLVTLQQSIPLLDSLHADLTGIARTETRIEDHRTGPIRLQNRIRLRNVGYRYPDAARDALSSISIEIPARTTVGFVGRTGCGKTTMVDVILGLLHTSAGHVEVDGTVVSEDNVRAWQANVGYVPQDIYLADSSIAANIAYGIPEQDIDMVAVEKAARIAELHDFVNAELPDGYATVVGERGVRLSGGQRQRIGIARALYNDPDVLVLDEATSALDNMTERAVMDAVARLARRKTIILIAHRLSTVQDCDRIFLLKDGALESQGSYGELVNGSPSFREMAGEEAAQRVI